MMNVLLLPSVNKIYCSLSVVTLLVLIVVIIVIVVDLRYFRCEGVVILFVFNEN